MNHDTESAVRASQMHRIPDGYWPRDSACPPCSQNCNQGRSCPTPTACEVPEPGSEMSEPAKAIVWAVVVVVALIGAASFVSPYF